MSWLDEPVPEPPPGRGHACPDCGARRWSEEAVDAHRREAHGVKASWEVAAEREADERRRRRREKPDLKRGAPAGGLRKGQVVRRRVDRKVHPQRWVVAETGVWMPDDDPRKRPHPAFLAYPEDGDPDDVVVFACAEAVAQRAGGRR